VSTTPDLSAWYKEYTTSVKKLQAGAADARERWMDMKDNTQAYIAKWDTEIADAKNPQVQETMEQRRQRVADSFQKMTDISVQVRDSYQPYVQDLQDIEKALEDGSHTRRSQGAGANHRQDQERRRGRASEA
jgi:hypothetical protein